LGIIVAITYKCNIFDAIGNEPARVGNSIELPLLSQLGMEGDNQLSGILSLYTATFEKNYFRKDKFRENTEPSKYLIMRELS